MAHHKSAKKRTRQNQKRRAHNRDLRSSLRSAIKGARTAIATGDGEARQTALRQAESKIRRAASKGILSKTQASRTVSRLTRAANRA